MTASMFDLLVAGGGPVGLATALYAERADLSVAVVEPRVQPVDKACGEGLMPGAVAALSHLGVEPPGRAFYGIRYIDGVDAAEALFRAGVGRGVRRTTLQSCLAAAVAERGIPVVQQHVGQVEQDGASVRCGDGLGARYLAAADGLHSPIRRLLGLEVSVSAHAPDRRFGLRRHYAVAPWTDLVEVHWANGLEAYVTPVDDECVGVALLTGRRAPFEEQLRAFPALRDRLGSTDRVTAPSQVEAAEGETAVKGAGPLRQRSRARVAGRVLLVGDAAGYVDALTGEGISVGMASARALVDAVVAGDPASYERSWLRVSRRYRWLTESLLWARNGSGRQSLIVPTAQRLPRVFASAVNQLAR